MNDRSNLPAVSELDSMQIAADSESNMQTMLKFKRGRYYMGDEEVPIGTKFIAHPVGWTKCWIKFVYQQFVERRMYRVAEAARVPERDELGDNDSKLWGPGMMGEHSDPWTLQYLLPLEDPDTGEVVVFVAGSVGGRRAVAGLCGTFARRRKRNPKSGSPVIALNAGEMPTARYGKVSCPILKLTGWTDVDGDAEIREVAAPTLKQDMDDDEIPF